MRTSPTPTPIVVVPIAGPSSTRLCSCALTVTGASQTATASPNSNMRRRAAPEHDATPAARTAAQTPPGEAAEGEKALHQSACVLMSCPRTVTRREHNMRYRLILSLALLALVLTVTACGEASACPPRPDSPGTFPSGPVSIETDHTVYAPGESPQVMILNLTPDPIRSTPPQGYGEVCPPVALQRLVGVQWQEVNVCVHVGGGDNVQPDHGISIARGLSPVRPYVPLTSPGTYRFVLSYGPLNRKGLCPCP